MNTPELNGCTVVELAETENEDEDPGDDEPLPKNSITDDDVALLYVEPIVEEALILNGVVVEFAEPTKEGVIIDVIEVEGLGKPGKEGVAVGMTKESEEFVTPATEEVKPDAIVVDEFEKMGTAEELMELAGRVGIGFPMPTIGGREEDEVSGCEE